MRSSMHLVAHFRCPPIRSRRTYCRLIVTWAVVAESPIAATTLTALACCAWLRALPQPLHRPIPMNANAAIIIRICRIFRRFTQHNERAAATPEYGIGVRCRGFGCCSELAAWLAAVMTRVELTVEPDSLTVLGDTEQVRPSGTPEHESDA